MSQNYLSGNIIPILAFITLFCTCINGSQCPIHVSGGSYFIQNRVDDLCITASGISGNINGTIQERGRLAMETCANIPSQEWKFLQNNPGKKDCAFRISSSMINKFHLEQNKLNVNLTGNFVQYWPEVIKIVDYTTLMDPRTHECFESKGKTNPPVYTPCSERRCKQLWKFTLVNDPQHLTEQI